MYGLGNHLAISSNGSVIAFADDSTGIFVHYCSGVASPCTVQTSQNVLDRIESFAMTGKIDYSPSGANDVHVVIMRSREQLARSHFSRLLSLAWDQVTETLCFLGRRHTWILEALFICTRAVTKDAGKDLCLPN